MTAPQSLAQLADMDGRRSLDHLLLAITGGYVVAAWIGLPLYGDGAYYWFKLAADESFVVPNLRVGAVLPQLPGMLMTVFTDDAVLLRHGFSLGYVALPVLSLLACWLIVRRAAPALLLFPLLWLAVHQINFSGVSELLTAAHLAWPFVLAAVLWPASRAVRGYGWFLGAIYVVLHPMACVPALALAGLAAWLGWRVPGATWRSHASGRQAALRWAWLELAAWLLVSGLVRLGWTVAGANRYERANLAGDGALHYLLPATPAQGLLLAVALLIGLLAAAALLRCPEHRARAMLLRLDWWLGWLLAGLVVLAAWVGGELLLGQGIKLKAALTFVAALLLMALAAVSGRVLSARAAPPPATARAQACSVPVGWLAAPATAVLILLAAKCAGWWLATNELGRIVAEADRPCIAHTAEEPSSLQWRWMVLVDEWPVGINALAFRPRAPAAPEVSLLLPNDGCDVLEATGEARLQSWIVRPWTQLDARFGPLRRLPDWR